MKLALRKVFPIIFGSLFIWLIAVMVADTLHVSIPPQGEFHSVNTEELVAIAEREFTIQFQPINTGIPSHPFSHSPDADHWFEHSQQVVKYEAPLTQAVKANLMTPVEIAISRYHRNDTWFEPRLSLLVDVKSQCLSIDMSKFPPLAKQFCIERIDGKDEGNKLLFYSYFEMSFHEVDGAWQVRAVWSPEKYYEVGDNRNSFFNRYCMNSYQPMSQQCSSDQKPWFIP